MDWINLVFTLPFKTRIKKTLKWSQRCLINRKKLNVLSKVPNQGQKRIARGWAFTQNLENKEFYSKATYIVCGFQEKLEIQSDLLTARKECLHIYHASHYCQ